MDTLKRKLLSGISSMGIEPLADHRRDKLDALRCSTLICRE